MPTSTRREKIERLNHVLLACHKMSFDYRTPALADKVGSLIRQFGFGQTSEKEYIRLIVDALAWESKNEGKEFRFAE
jgi:hypothetical protein